MKKNKQKKPNVFLIKKPSLYAGVGSKQLKSRLKTFSNCQATYQKELCTVFEKLGNFFTKLTYR